MKILKLYFRSKLYYFLMLLLAALFISCTGSQDARKNADPGSDTATNQLKVDSSSLNVEQTPVKTSDPRYQVVISTNLGNIILELYNETPLHRDNFLKLVRQGYYNKTLFHRVIKDFMIQGGDPNSKNADMNTMLGNGGPGYNIPAEFSPKLFHKKGALAAARQGDEINPKKASSGSQFYIVHGKKYSHYELENIAVQTGISFSPERIRAYENIGGSPFLDGNYTVFGEVVEGLDVVDRIAEVKTGAGNRPSKDIIMEIKIIETK